MTTENTGPTKREKRLAGRQFLAFSSVESDPNASSANWLKAELTNMADLLRSGRRLWIYEPTTGALVSVRSPAQLLDWATRHFPVAGFNL